MALDKPALAQGERDPFKIVFVLRWLVEHFALPPDVSGLAPINSPVLTGDPKSVTPPPGDNDTSIATTAFVAQAITPPAYNNYTPIITAGSGAFTTVSATGRFFQFGKFVHCNIRINITTNGTAAGYVLATLPVTAASVDAGHGVGREDAVVGTILEAKLLTTTSLYIANYNASYPGADGYQLGVSICYEAA
jgi:hypothetical protein